MIIITSVFKFRNNDTHSYDQDHKKLPQFSGKWDEVKRALYLHAAEQKEDITWRLWKPRRAEPEPRGISVND